jgi:hypothetical protein
LQGGWKWVGLSVAALQNHWFGDRSSLVYQLGQIAVYLLIYAGLACFQLTAVERWLQGLGLSQWIVRPGFSLAHAALGYAVFLGVLLLSNVVASGDYRRGWFDPYSLLVPVAGSVIGATLPWLPLVRGGRRAEPSATADRGRS